jgi:hypothetical protein
MPRCVYRRHPDCVANAVQSPSARRHCGYRCYEPEQRVLKTMGVIDFVQQLGTDRRIPCSVRAKNDRKEPEKALA